MLTINCPACGVDGSISMAQSVYDGPYRCWKCRQLFMIRIVDNELKLCEPLSEADFEKWQEQQDSSDR